jgi:mycothiol synthase
MASVTRIELVRRLTPDLQRTVDQLADAAREVDGVRAFGEHKWLRLVRGDDRCAALLLWQDEHLVGAAHCDAYHTAAPDRPCRLTAELVVDPAHRHLGLGSQLLEGVRDLANEEVAQELHVWAYGDLPQAQRLALGFGYQAERTLLQYVMPADRLPGSPELPPDVRLRAFNPHTDAQTWLELHNRVFAGHPEQSNWDMADLQARFDQPWFDPRDLLIAERATTSQVLGFCWVKLPADRSLPGEIYIVGVDPAARGQRIGQILTQAGLAHMREDGRPGAMLFVEATNQPAIALYERLGFERHHVHACYALRVPAPNASLNDGADTARY